jgi:hypothetical protein
VAFVSLLNIGESVVPLALAASLIVALVIERRSHRAHMVGPMWPDEADDVFPAGNTAADCKEAARIETHRIAA